MFYVDLQVAVPPELAGDFLAKLHYVAEGLDRFELVGAQADRVRFALTPGAVHDSATVGARIAEVAQRMCEDYRPKPATVLHVRRDNPVPFGGDPHPLLEAAGQLKRFGSGRYGLGPLPARLLELFEQRYRKFGTDLAATEYRFPSLIGADVLDRCRYLRAFPHALSLVSHLREDLAAVQQLARDARWTNDHLEVPPGTLADPKCLLSSTICFHHYAWLENTPNLSNHTITALGRCYRYESGNLTGLERLWDFSMREFVYVGQGPYVLAQRQRSIDLALTMLDEWGLNYEILTATDPFFIEDYSAQIMFQQAFDLKYEVAVPLPYKPKALAIGSFNYHQDFFGRSLNFTQDDGQACHTGCVGFGLERVVLAFLAQYGLDATLWPAAVRAAW